MAVTLSLDLLDQAAFFDDGPDGVRACRVGIAEGLSGVPAEYLYQVLEAAGMPATGAAHPAYSGATVNRRLIRGMTDAGDKARVEIYYESPEIGGEPNGTFVVRDSTALTQELVELDRNFTPLTVTFDPTGSASSVTKGYRSARLTPIRTLSFYAMLDTRPSASVLACVGCVNDQLWQGLPRGYWLCAGVDTQFADAVGAVAQRSITVTFISRLYRDWSEYGWYIKPDGEIPTEAEGLDPTLVTNLMTGVYAPLNSGVNGFSKVGHYETKDFFDIFGV